MILPSLLALLLGDFGTTPFQVCSEGDIFTEELGSFLPKFSRISQPEPLLPHGKPWMRLLNHSYLAQISQYVVIHPAFKALRSPH